MKRALPLMLLALAACSRSEPEPASTDGAADFASRVGGAAPAGQGTAVAAPAANATAAIAMDFKKGEVPYAMQRLGDASGVDLGPNRGGCVLLVDGVPMMQAATPIESTLPGKAVVRIGGQLLRVDSAPGVALGKMGGDFNGEGFRVEVRPDGKGGARVTTVDIEGESHVLTGKWNCV